MWNKEYSGQYILEILEELEKSVGEKIDMTHNKFLDELVSLKEGTTNKNISKEKIIDFCELLFSIKVLEEVLGEEK